MAPNYKTETEIKMIIEVVINKANDKTDFTEKLYVCTHKHTCMHTVKCTCILKTIYSGVRLLKVRVSSAHEGPQVPTSTNP